MVGEEISQLFYAHLPENWLVWTEIKWEKAQRTRRTDSGKGWGAVIGGVLGSIVAPGLGTMAGAALGAAIGNEEDKEYIEDYTEKKTINHPTELAKLVKKLETRANQGKWVEALAVLDDIKSFVLIEHGKKLKRLTEINDQDLVNYVMIGQPPGNIRAVKFYYVYSYTKVKLSELNPSSRPSVKDEWTTAILASCFDNNRGHIKTIRTTAIAIIEEQPLNEALTWFCAHKSFAERLGYRKLQTALDELAAGLCQKHITNALIADKMRPIIDSLLTKNPADLEMLKCYTFLPDTAAVLDRFAAALASIDKVDQPKMTALLSEYIGRGDSWFMANKILQILSCCEVDSNETVAAPLTAVIKHFWIEAIKNSNIEASQGWSDLVLQHSWMQDSDNNYNVLLVEHYILLGNEFAYKNRLSKSLENFQKALKITPGNVPCLLGAARVSLSLCKKSMLDNDQARQYLCKVLHYVPGHSEALKLLADDMVDSSKTDTFAFDIYRQALPALLDDDDFVEKLFSLCTDKAEYRNIKSVFDIMLATGWLNNQNRAVQFIFYLAKGDINEPELLPYIVNWANAADWPRPILSYLSRILGKAFTSADEVKPLLNLFIEAWRYPENRHYLSRLLVSYYLGSGETTAEQLKYLEWITRSDNATDEIDEVIAQIIKIYHFYQRWPELIRWYRKIDQPLPILTLLYAEALLEEGHEQEVYPCLNVVVTPMLEPWKLYLEGRLYLNRQQLEQAKSAFEQVLKIDPNFKKAYQFLGKIQKFFDEKGQAIVYYQNYLVVNPHDIAAIQELVEVHEQLGEVDKAEGVLLQGLKNNPDDPVLIRDLAEIRVANGRGAEALHEYLKLADDVRQQPMVLFGMGIAFQNCGNYIAAKTCYQNVLTAQPKHRQALNNLLVLELDQGNLEEASSFAERLQYEFAYTSSAKFNEGLYLIEIGKCKKALESFRGINQGPLWFRAKLAEAWCLLSFNQLKQAQRILMELQPSVSTSFETVWLYLKQLTAYRLMQPRKMNDYERLRVLAGEGGLASAATVTEFWSIYNQQPDAEKAAAEIRRRNIPAVESAHLLLLEHLGNWEEGAAVREKLTAQAGKKLSSFFINKLPGLNKIAGESFGFIETEVKGFGEWEIVGEPIEGGMATVRKVYHAGLECYGALKQLKPKLVTESLTRENFRQEALLLARLNHDNITKVYEESIHIQPFAFVMEWMGKGSLLGYIHSRRRLEYIEALLIFREVAKGVAYFHSLDSENVHQDLSLDNVLINENGQIKVADFGVARLQELNSEFTVDQEQVAAMTGKLPYMAPEVHEGIDASQAADQYSLGVILYQMLTGKLPIAPEDEAADIGAWRFLVSIEEPTPLASFGINVPVDVEKLVFKMLAKQPQERYQSLDVVLEEVSRILRKYGDDLGVGDFLLGGMNSNFKRKPEESQSTVKEKANTAQTVFEEWEPTGVIVEGGICQVAQMLHKPSGRLAALKMLKPQFISNKNVIETFKAEAEFLMSHNIKGIVRGMPGSLDMSKYSFLLEWTDGYSLDNENVMNLSIVAKSKLVLQILDIVAGFHEGCSGGLHRDLSLNNFLVSGDEVVLIDFGSARTNASQHLKSTFTGKWPYLAPEVLNAAKFTVASEIYALGVVVCYLFSGRFPINQRANENLASWTRRVSSERPCVAFSHECPKGFTEIVEKMVDKAEVKRFATVRDVWRQWKEINDNEGF